jgi:lipid-A-disaccharide synthase
VALLPGSRVGELNKHFPILISAARTLLEKRRHLRFLWIAPDETILEKGHKILQAAGADSLPLESCVGYQLSHLHRCDLALLASGSVSLECAVVGVPQIVFYKVHPLTYQIGRMVVKIKYLSMVNVLADQAVVPELVQHDLDPDELAERALALLTHPKTRQVLYENTRPVMQKLGPPGASERAAKLILQEIKQ